VSKVVVDPLKAIMKPLPEVELSPRDTALLIIDMQYLDAHPEEGLVKLGREKGLDMDYYSERLKLITANIKRLLTACREKGYEVIHTKIEALTRDGRDRSRIHKLLLDYGRGTRDTEIIEELAPLDNEIVLTKTCSGVFNGTHIHQVLLNLGIQTLIVTGVVTNQCVDTAVRDAADRGFNVILVEDGCAAVTKELHEATIEILGGVYARIKSTEEVLASLK
jgi:nicotinamidase-related amidase